MAVKMKSGSIFFPVMMTMLFFMDGSCHGVLRLSVLAPPSGSGFVINVGKELNSCYRLSFTMKPDPRPFRCGRCGGHPVPPIHSK